MVFITLTDFKISFYFKINSGGLNQACICGNLVPSLQRSQLVTWGRPIGVEVKN
jgi:hypothetical protein